MTLTAKELAQLSKLQEKAAMEHTSLTDEEIKEMEDRAAKHYDIVPARFKTVMDSWNDFCGVLSSLSGDNLKLIAEIRHLRAESQAKGE